MILESKLRGERLTFVFHFSDEMDVLETIESHDFVVTVLSGSDDDPMDLLYGVGDHEDGLQQVTQQFHAGIPGVIYLLTCAVVTSAARELRRQAKLAILPSPLLGPPLFGTLYTTHLYPIEVLETLDHAVLDLNGRLQVMPFPLEEYEHAILQISGALSGGLVTFSTPVEAIDHALLDLSGTLRTLLLTYSIPPDEIEHALLNIAGTLEVKLIPYDAPVESIDHAILQLSGTLV